MNNPITFLDHLEIDLVERIPQQDRDYFDSIEEEYKAVIDELFSIKDSLTSLSRNYPQRTAIRENDHGNTKCIHADSPLSYKDRSSYHRCFYSFNDTLVRLQDLIQKAHFEYISKIKSYLFKSYNINLFINGLPNDLKSIRFGVNEFTAYISKYFEDLKFFDYRVVLPGFYEEHGFDLIEAGKTELLKELKAQAKDFICKGKVIKFNTSCWLKAYNYDKSSTKDILYKLFYIFEYGSLTGYSDWKARGYKEGPQSTGIQKIKNYQNGRVDITFFNTESMLEVKSFLRL